MSGRYVRPTVAGWLTPTLIAPWLSTYAAVTAVAALGLDLGLFGKVLGWVAGMLVGSVWAFAFCLVLVVVDVALLAVKVRTLPSGRRGWGTAFLAPLLVFGAYTVAPPYTFIKYGPWSVAAAVAVPMVLVAIATRVIAGIKPLR